MYQTLLLDVDGTLLDFEKSQAKALELAGKGGDVDYIQENHPALLRGYVELCAYIDGI